MRHEYRSMQMTTDTLGQTSAHQSNDTMIKTQTMVIYFGVDGVRRRVKHRASLGGGVRITQERSVLTHMITVVVGLVGLVRVVCTRVHRGLLHTVAWFSHASPIEAPHSTAHLPHVFIVILL